MKKTTFPLIFSIIAAFCFWTCSEEVASLKENITKKGAIIEEAKNVEVFYSDSAVVRIKITSPTLLTYVDKENPRDEFPNGIRLDFFNQSQQATSILTGKYAIRYPTKNQVIIQDSCVWQSVSSQEKLEAFELIWDENQQKVYSNKLVIISTPSEKIWGYGFETNQDFSRWKINKPQGRLAVDKIE